VVVEKTMFGGIALLLSGNMCCGIHRDQLIVRLDAAAEEALDDQPR
jgi:TfoX/Sxy family transcriptional regulator of competence genes